MSVATLAPDCISDPIVERHSVYDGSEQEIQRFKWILSEKAGCDQGEAAMRQWVREHWNGYLRSCWLEHLQGRRFWVELDRGDFGLLHRSFKEDQVLLDRIVDRLIAGQENLDIICWARQFHLNLDRVLEILEVLDVNSRRLSHRFE